MRRFLAAHLNLVVGACLSLAGIALALYLSGQADRRQTELIEHERQWRAEDRIWEDSTNVQAARNDSLLMAVMDSLRAMHRRAIAQRERLEARHHTKE